MELNRGENLIMFGVHELFKEGKTKEEILEIAKNYIKEQEKHNKKG